MAIYLIQLLDEIRARLDDAGGNLIDDGTTFAMWQHPDVDAQLLWHNRDLCHYLNIAIGWLSERVPFKDSLTPAVCQIPVKSGVSTYPLHSSILAITGVWLDSTGLPLDKTTVGRLNYEYEGAAWRLQYGPPVLYLEDSQYRCLSLFPVPFITSPPEQVIDTVRLEVLRRYLAPRFVWNTELAAERELETTIPEIPENLRAALIAGVCIQAWRKRDVDTFNTQAAQEAAVELDALVGPALDVRTLENRRLRSNLKRYTFREPYERFGAARERVAALFKMVRRRLDDYGVGGSDTEADAVSWADPQREPLLKWRTRHLCDYLAWAIREIGWRNPVKDSTTPEVCHIPVLAGVRLYPIHPSILEIKNVRLASTGFTLGKTMVHLLNQNWGSNWTAQQGIPLKYCEDEQLRQITLFPYPEDDDPLVSPPSIVDTLHLEVFRSYLAANVSFDNDLAATTVLSTVLAEVPEQYDAALIAGICAQAWLRSDVSTPDPKSAQMAQFAMAEFNSLAGPPVDAWTLEQRRLNANLLMEIRTY